MNDYQMNGPVIPESLIQLAKEVAEKAKGLNIDHFTLSFNPKWDTTNSCHGEAKIHFSRTDGRGRPCYNLNIQVETSLRHNIEFTPESSN